MTPHTDLSPEQALLAVLTDIPAPATEELPLAGALGRFLPDPLNARLEDPRFDKAAVDGIGIAGAELFRGSEDTEFTVIATIAAGSGEDPVQDLGPNEAVRIMTGAPVPPAVGQVIKFENCAIEGNRVRILEPERISNIARRGENIRPGDPLMGPRRLTPQDLGVLASQGYHVVTVAPAPVVTVIATGDEIFPPGAVLPPGGIYDSNSTQLAACAAVAGAQVINRGIVRDDREALEQEVRRACESSQVVILSGGVSMGDLDYVPETLEALGGEVVFHGLSMKPGRPTLYGLVPGGSSGPGQSGPGQSASQSASQSPSHGPVRLFGLPGNPVSTFVQFEMFIRPLLWALCGVTYRPREARLPLPAGFTRGNADRHEFRPGRYRDGAVEPLQYSGSGHVSILSEADLLFRIDRGVKTVEPGGEVHARFLR